jgi:hypothetical protein
LRRTATLLAASRNVDHLSDSGDSDGGDSHLLLSLLLLSDGSTAPAAFAVTLIAATLIAAGPNAMHLGDSGSSGGCNSLLLLLLLLLLISSGKAPSAFLCCHGGCQHLCLGLDSFLLCFYPAVLRGLLKWLLPVRKAALSEYVPYFLILERRTCLDHVESSHCIRFALLFLETYSAWVFRNPIPPLNKSSSARSNPGQASITSKTGLQ